MEILSYIISSAITWFIGFFPYFEIYVAIPAGLAIGLNLVNAYFWASLGNWMVIPFVHLSYEWLLKFNFMKKVNEKANTNKLKNKMEKYGAWFIIILTPIVGVWSVAILGKVLQYDKKSLFLFSGISISIIGLIIALLIKIGVTFVS